MLEDADLSKLVPRGGTRQFELHVAKLPTGTLINIHAFVYRGRRPGPVLLLTGGLHGDEINGVEIIRRMMAQKLLMPEGGTVMAIPVLNIYGFLNFARDMPDGKDANRSFPGTRNGSLASRMAYTVTRKILPHIDLGIDFHTGGAIRTNAPQVRCDFSDEESVKMAEAFGAPFVVNSTFIPQSLRNEARQMGKTIIVFEGGQSLQFDDQVIEEGIEGVLRTMRHLNMIAHGSVPRRRKRTRFLPRTTWVRAENAGLFHIDVKSGSFVKEGARLGTITDPYNDYEVEVISPAQGYAIGVNCSAVVNAGDALVHIGSEAERKMTVGGDIQGQRSV